MYTNGDKDLVGESGPLYHSNIYCSLTLSSDLIMYLTIGKCQKEDTWNGKTLNLKTSMTPFLYE